MKEKFSAALIIVLFLTSVSFSSIALSSGSEDDGVISFLEELETEIEGLQPEAFVRPRLFRVMKRNMLRMVEAAIEDVEDGKFQMARMRALRALVQHQLKEPWRTDLTDRIDELLVGERALFSISEILEAATDGDAISAGVQECSSVFWMELDNQDDVFDADIVDPGFHVEASDTVTYADWEEYVTLDDTSVDWDFPVEFAIPEGESLYVNFGVDHTEDFDMEVSVSRAMNPVVFNDDGIQEVCITVTFTNTDYMWYFGHIAAYEHEGLSASIVPESFSTDAPIKDWWETTHYVNIHVDEESIEAGEPYHFYVSVNVDVTGEVPPPIMYKPHFDMMYLTAEEFAPGGVGGTAEMPPEMLPDCITDAQASADGSISWTLMRMYEARAKLNEVVVQVP